MCNIPPQKKMGKEDKERMIQAAHEENFNKNIKICMSVICRRNSCKVV